jgi:hypothetical protein
VAQAHPAVGELPPDFVPSEQAADGLASHLAAYATDLPARDRAALTTILLRAMDPVDRMRLRDAQSLLSPDELAVLRGLLDETSQG